MSSINRKQKKFITFSSVTNCWNAKTRSIRVFGLRSLNTDREMTEVSPKVHKERCHCWVTNANIATINWTIVSLSRSNHTVRKRACIWIIIKSALSWRNAKRQQRNDNIYKQLTSQPGHVALEKSSIQLLTNLKENKGYPMPLFLSHLFDRHEDKSRNSSESKLYSRCDFVLLLQLSLFLSDLHTFQ